MRRLPPRRICTPSGKAFPSVLAHELVCQVPSLRSVGALHENAWQSKTCSNSWPPYISCIRMTHLWKSLRIMHPLMPLLPLESLPSYSPALPSSGPATQTPVPNPSPPPSASRVLGRVGRGAPVHDTAPRVNSFLILRIICLLGRTASLSLFLSLAPSLSLFRCPLFLCLSVSLSVSLSLSLSLCAPLSAESGILGLCGLWAVWEPGADSCQV